MPPKTTPSGADPATTRSRTNTSPGVATSGSTQAVAGTTTAASASGSNTNTGGSQSTPAQSGSTTPAVTPLSSMTNIGDIYVVLAAQHPDLPPAVITSLAQAQLETNVRRIEGAFAPVVPATAPGLAPPLQPVVVDTKPNDNKALTTIHKMVKDMPKLSQVNWQTWYNDLQDVLKYDTKASDILVGNKGPGTASYDPDYDQKLVIVVKSGCDRDSSKNIRFLVDGKTWDSGAALLSHLKKELTKNIKQQRAAIMFDLANVKLYQNDVSRAVQAIQDIKTRADQLGAECSEDRMAGVLLSLTGTHSNFYDCWRNLEHDGEAQEWAPVVRSLTRRQAWIENVPYSRDMRPVAMRTSEHPMSDPLPQTERKPLTRQEAYNIGKRDPKNPDKPAACYNCHKTGHISKNCPAKEASRIAQELEDDIENLVGSSHLAVAPK